MHVNMICNDQIYYNKIKSAWYSSLMSQKQRVRYHQYMKPRNSNPTYASSSISNAISMAYWHKNDSLQNIRRSQSIQDISKPSANNLQSYPIQKSQLLDSPAKKTTNASIQNQQKQSEQKAGGRLLNAGSKSLRKLPEFTQRDIYEKQQSKYNIITVQPKEYNETIKKYPKYRLQNMDVNYFKKLQLQNQYSTMRGSQLLKNSSLNQQPLNAQ